MTVAAGSGAGPSGIAGGEGRAGAPAGWPLRLARLLSRSSGRLCRGAGHSRRERERALGRERSLTPRLARQQVRPAGRGALSCSRRGGAARARLPGGTAPPPPAPGPPAPARLRSTGSQCLRTSACAGCRKARVQVRSPLSGPGTVDRLRPGLAVLPAAGRPSKRAALTSGLVWQMLCFLNSSWVMKEKV